MTARIAGRSDRRLFVATPDGWHAIAKYVYAVE